MKTLIVFESLFGATHAIADEIAIGIDQSGEITASALQDIDARALPLVDLLVLGAPTHNHRLSTIESRTQAALLALDSFSGLQLDRGESDSIGMREWLNSVSIPAGTRLAVFDTRIRGPRVLIGSAGHDIVRILHSAHLDLIAKPMSFYVMENHRLEPGQRSRARQWGNQLATGVLTPAR